MLCVRIRTDQLFLPEQMQVLSAHLRDRGVVVDEFTIDSPHGHDSFLIEWDQVTALIAQAFALPLAPREDAPPQRPGASGAL